ncbi:Ger(x)C family spore germination protein [Bacillus hwajinpoensis]|uniref:Ger(X)C family spore germination protein n=1 Tax=Guptibacillus hwajinpoensis TaxID=208199 RepID=A0A845F114_9BACL|nr:Ger(x)C family spore germination protein [Pseudalkalibacillus hwajinpoensis]MYL64490.1 Ger(x)C family spore germination protein [Pseudalkalibacillus hwajinpoensis]
MIRKTLLLLLLLCFPITGGCWDQSALKDKRIINGASFDVSDNDPDLILGAIRTIQLQSKGGSELEIKDNLIKGETKTVGELHTDLQNKVSGKMDVGKAFIIIVGEELAMKKDLTSIIEPVYRSSKGYIASKMVLSKGKGFDLLNIDEQQKSPIAFEILRLLEGSEDETNAPLENTFTVMNKLADKEEDIMLPILESQEENQIQIAGAALFNGEKYSGIYLTVDQIPLLLFMKDELQKRSKIHIETEEFPQPFSIEIQNVKRAFDVKLNKNNKIQCEIQVTLNAKVTSYYNDGGAIDVEQLTDIASKALTDRAKTTIGMLQEANSDVLGIEKVIKTQYPEYWKEQNWDNVFEHITINPKMKVDIFSTYGIN